MEKSNENKIILYARASVDNHKYLDDQIQKLHKFVSSKYKNKNHVILDEIKEVNTSLDKLNEIFERSDFDMLLINNNDRLSRYKITSENKSDKTKKILADVKQNDSQKMFSKAI